MYCTIRSWTPHYSICTIRSWTPHYSNCNAGHILRLLDGNRHFDPQLKLGDAILAFLKEAKDNENTVNLGDVKTAIRDAGDLLYM